MNQVSKREHVLMLTCFVVAAVIGYWMFRFRPIQAQISSRQEQGVLAGKEIDEFQMPVEPQENDEKLAAELAELETILKKSQDQLTTLEGKFADSKDPGSIQQLKVEISDLANRMGVKIAESVPFDIKQADSALRSAGQTRTIGQNLLSSVYERPTHQMKFQCGFRNLVEFISGLAELSHRIVVLKLDMQTETKTDKVPAPQLLSVEIVLAL